MGSVRRRRLLHLIRLPWRMARCLPGSRRGSHIADAPAHHPKAPTRLVAKGGDEVAGLGHLSHEVRKWTGRQSGRTDTHGLRWRCVQVLHK